MKLKNLRFKGDVSVYILIMLGMAIGMYLMGFTSVIVGSIDASGQIDAGELLDDIADGIISAFTELEILIPMLGFGFLSGIAGKNYAGGTILSYLIPILIMFVVVNIFAFPIVSTVQAHSSDTPAMGMVTAILSVFFNAMLFLAVLEYSSGRN